MASYPSLAVSSASRLTYEDGIVADRASNGQLRGRSFWNGKKARIALRHEQLSAADKTTLLDFYDANRATTFDLTFDGVNYPTVMFEPDAVNVEYRGLRYDVSVRVREA